MRGDIQLGDGVLQVAARLAALVDTENRVVLVTSYDERDGASDLAAQLAIGLSRISQASVVLVDANRATPTLHKTFDVARSPGFGELIVESAELPKALREVAAGITLIPAGSLEGPVPLPDCARFCDSLRARFRYVVIAAAPLLQASEAVTLSSLSDGVILAFRAGVRNRHEVKELQRELARFRVRLLGAVIRQGR